MTRKQRSYHAFVRTAKEKFELSHKQALALYRNWKDKFSGRATAHSLSQHPRVAKRLSDAIKHRRGGLGLERQGRTKRAEAELAPAIRGRGATGRRINTISQWDEYYDDFPDADIEYEASADYGEE